MAEGNLISPRDILAQFEQKFIDALQKSLEDNDRLVAGVLWQSIKASTSVYGQKIELSISMEDYWKFVNAGVDGTESKHGSKYKFKNDGKPANIKGILKFIANRGITPAMSISRQRTLEKVKGKGKLSNKIRKGLKQKNKADALKSLAFAIGKNVKKKGIKPTFFASEVMEGNLIKQFRKELSESVGREIKIEIAKITNE